VQLAGSGNGIFLRIAAQSLGIPTFWVTSPTIIFRQGKIREALAADAEAIKADRYNPRRCAEFGRKLAANKQFEQAIVCFKNALLLNPRDITIQVNLAQTLIAAKHGKDASVVCEQAMQTAKESGDKQVIQTIASFCNSAILLRRNRFTDRLQPRDSSAFFFSFSF
jgi:predicted Zn-dependent protease